MAFSTFVFDTLDVSARLGRYIVQELFAGARARRRPGDAPHARTARLCSGSAGRGVLKFWTLFGASNQLLAALTLLGITFWLHKARRRIWFTLFPMRGGGGGGREGGLRVTSVVGTLGNRRPPPRAAKG